MSKESGKSQIETAFELNITNDTKVAELLSESFSIPLVKLDDVKVDNNLKKFTEIRFLKENLIIPFEVDAKTIKVAIADASKLVTLVLPVAVTFRRFPSQPYRNL